MSAHWTRPMVFLPPSIYAHGMERMEAKKCCFVILIGPNNAEADATPFLIVIFFPFFLLVVIVFVVTCSDDAAAGIMVIVWNDEGVGLVDGDGHIDRCCQRLPHGTHFR